MLANRIYYHTTNYYKNLVCIVYIFIDIKLEPLIAAAAMITISECCERNEHKIIYLALHIYLYIFRHEHDSYRYICVCVLCLCMYTVYADVMGVWLAYMVYIASH